jgi:hypothetical protein
MYFHIDTGEVSHYDDISFTLKSKGHSGRWYEKEAWLLKGLRITHAFKFAIFT